MARLARWCFRHRTLVFAGWLLALIVVTAVSHVAGFGYVNPVWPHLLLSFGTTWRPGVLLRSGPTVLLPINRPCLTGSGPLSLWSQLLRPAWPGLGVACG